MPAKSTPAVIDPSRQARFAFGLYDDQLAPVVRSLINSAKRNSVHVRTWIDPDAQTFVVQLERPTPPKPKTRNEINVTPPSSSP